MSPEEPIPEESPPKPRGLSFNLRELILIVALIALVLAALTPWFQRKRELALVSQAKADLRSLCTAIESYRIDFMAYPLCGLAEGPPRVMLDGTVIPTGTLTVHSHLPVGSGARRTLTFGVVSPSPHVLTTPIGYLTAYPADPFTDTRGATFGYFTRRYPSEWFLWSVGPDRDENAPDGPGDLGTDVERIDMTGRRVEIPPSGAQRYRRTVTVPPDDFLNRVYDPSNGVSSNGDVVRTCNGWERGSR